jgi:D-arabinan exo alpha-(1,3)/(1,5)-arabinofuranosidase (non-reducing end)
MDLSFDGLGSNMGNLSRLSNAEIRSIIAENFTGAKGQAGMTTEGTGSGPSRELGRTGKVSPSINIAWDKKTDMGQKEGQVG